jgi:hypothetical protein
VGAYFLPFDIYNFAFSDKANLTEAAQDTQISALNHNILNATPQPPATITPATVKLINGWYPSGGGENFGYVPPEWSPPPSGVLEGDQAMVATTAYSNFVARSCRTCHTAQVDFDWDSLGPAGFWAEAQANVCSAYNMPNAVTPFNRFWDSHIDAAVLPPGTYDQVALLLDIGIFFPYSGQTSPLICMPPNAP